MTLIYILFASMLLAIYYLGLLLFYRKKKVSNALLNPDNLSVVIAFRNEEANLPKLIESIKKFTKFPKEFIFVNDHSTDLGEELLCEIPDSTNFKIISLNKQQTGKKTAIKTGVEQAQGEYILTWDADISVPANYFEILAKTEQVDLLILPVKMSSNTWYAAFFELDYAYLPNLQLSLAGFHAYFVCSGANLMFSRESFLSFDHDLQKPEIASGDDLFLLRNMKQKRKQISLCNLPDLQVETTLPPTFSAVLHQRLRWIGKTNAVGDSLATLLGIIGLIYHFFPLIWLLICPSQWIVLPIKIVIDSLLFFPYLKQQGSLNRLCFVPLFSLLYPLYILLILIMLPWFKPNWKGREL